MEKRRKTIRQREAIEFEIRKKNTADACVCIFFSNSKNRNEFSFSLHTNSSLTITHTQSNEQNTNEIEGKTVGPIFLFSLNLSLAIDAGDQIERPGLFTFSHCIAN